jgi:hypothetical protein
MKGNSVPVLTWARKYRFLDVSQLHGPPWPVTGIALPLSVLFCHKDVWESGGIALPFLISTLKGGKWSASPPSHFTLWKILRHSVERRMSGPQSWSAQDGKDKSPFLSRKCNPVPPALAQWLRWLGHPSSSTVPGDVQNTELLVT